MPEPTTTTEEMNPYKIALRQLAHVAGILGLDDSIHGILQKPKRELTVNFPVNMEARRDADVHGLPRPAQHQPGAGQRRPALPPGDGH